MKEGPPRAGWLVRLRRIVAERPLGAMLATAAAAALVAVVLTRQISPHPPAAIARVPSSKVALVKIDFVAERAVEDVQFEIMLPDGLRFFSRGQELAERTFRWNGRLLSGSNPLPIAVKGAHPGRYRVIAHAVGDGIDVTHEVVLEVTS
jgi:hypothetical protein